MKNVSLFLCLSFVVLFSVGSGVAASSDNPLAEKLVGKWKQEMIGARTGGAIISITTVDATGRISGKYIPPSGPAGGKEFDIIGWVSSAPAQEKADNGITGSFTGRLPASGSISSATRSL